MLLNFWTCVRVGTRVGNTCNRASAHYRPEDKSTCFFRQLDAGVCRLARLRNRNDQIFIGNYWISIAEFDTYSTSTELCSILKQIFTHKTCMPRGATCNDDDSLGVLKHFCVLPIQTTKSVVGLCEVFRGKYQ